MKAAIAALPFETPKLAVTAMVEGEGIAALLEALARIRSGEIGSNKPPPMIEAKPNGHGRLKRPQI
jgi:hypothetical protein